MKLEIHIHVHNNESESLALIKEIHLGLTKGDFIMALSPEMQAFVDSVTAALSSAGASLDNISSDIQRLLASGGLSADDKAALVNVTEQLNTLSVNLANAAAVVPE